MSATIALMLEANPMLSPAEVKHIVMSTATPLKDFPVQRSGAGLVNAGRAVAAARRAARGVWNVMPFSPHIQDGLIDFTYFDPSSRADRVALIGSFNGWNSTATPMTPNGDYSIFTADVPFTTLGGIEYKYVVYTDTLHTGPAKWNSL